MPAWWGRKSNKSKEETHQNNSNSNILFFELNSKKSPNNSDNSNSNSNSNGNSKNKRSPRSIEEFGRGILSPKLRGNNCREFGSSGNGAASSGISWFDSDCERKVVGHPLPRPTNSGVVAVDHGSHGGVGLLASGSASISSVSSSESNSDDHPILLDGFSGRAKSPGPASRGATTATSPIHPRLASVKSESPTGRQEEGSRGHPLPLPPSSPTSPSSLPNGRAGLFTESSQGTYNSLSKWKKGKLLGRGTFGHVYLGFNSEGGHMCAIKEVRIVSDDQNSKESLKQLKQEIDLLSQLSHPNIVRYYGSDLAGDTLSVYLEYVSGGSIHKLLQEYGPFKEPVIQNYTRQILSGLAYLHSRTTVHRDIKGANILVDPTGEIKLADFGMAKHITSCNSVLSFKGSPYWMAPEVVMNKSGYNLAVDIWSLGCTILEMAMAKPPWSQYEGVAAIFKIGNSKDIPEIPDFLSSEAKNFLHLCLKRDPADRPLASSLLDHPFVREQSVGKNLNFNAPNEATTFSFDGRRKPQPLEIHPRRKSISSYDPDNMRKPGLTIWEARDNPRSITSLPVSPSSSPLHRLAPTSKSCLLSPPHPSYAWPGQSSYNLNDHSVSPTRRRAGYTLDPWIESTLFKTQTPGGSPNMWLI
ncbi:mitogen-activated protein kinase kinase kinase 3-like [Chenopodium quinoa]|uniref:mitogen-activated protein kinase kinase kinase 3-like n=1 Tax=Chenopodium quinoa TaxID=63459 RepID=UPI000B7741CC|nr:mitogen-activated protein kinase kinase kinase 3-like [Chenopodium quinoa]